MSKNLKWVIPETSNFLKRAIPEMSNSWNEQNPQMRMNMVCKKSLPAVKCEHPGRKRSHRFNLHISNMDILQKNWFKSLIPARNRRSNILLHTWRGCHRLLNIKNPNVNKLSRAINYNTTPISLNTTCTQSSAPTLHTTPSTPHWPHWWSPRPYWIEKLPISPPSIFNDPWA